MIVLKQRTRSAARWLVDLLHELYHAAQEPEKMTRAVLEEAPFDRADDQEEIAATEFASEVVLNGRAEELFQRVAEQAEGQLPRFKRIVPQVARREAVQTGALANYIAWRLANNAEYSHNWWGTATNLQEDNRTDIALARRLCFEHLTADVDEPSVGLLFRALRAEAGQ